MRKYVLAYTNKTSAVQQKQPCRKAKNRVGKAQPKTNAHSEDVCCKQTNSQMEEEELAWHKQPRATLMAADNWGPTKKDRTSRPGKPLCTRLKFQLEEKCPAQCSLARAASQLIGRPHMSRTQQWNIQVPRCTRESLFARCSPAAL